MVIESCGYWLLYYIWLFKKSLLLISVLQCGSKNNISFWYTLEVNALNVTKWFTQYLSTSRWKGSKLIFTYFSLCLVITTTIIFLQSIRSFHRVINFDLLKWTYGHSLKLARIIWSSCLLVGWVVFSNVSNLTNLVKKSLIEIPWSV